MSLYQRAMCAIWGHSWIVEHLGSVIFGTPDTVVCTGCGRRELRRNA